MAGTVTTDLAFFSSGSGDSSCDSVATWSGSPTVDTESMIQGTGCLVKKVSATTTAFLYAPTSSVNLTGKLVYIWLQCLTPGLLGTKAAGGLRFRVQDVSSNYGDWYLDGSDTYGGGWKCYCIVCDTAYSYVTATAPTLTAITSLGPVFYMTGSTAKTNCMFDAMRYGTYLQVYAGTEGSPATINDLYTTDNTNKYGVIIKDGPIYKIQGDLRFGTTTASTNTYFKDVTGAAAIFLKNPAYFATGSRILSNAATPVPLPSHNKITLLGSSGGTTEIYFGDKAGGSGFAGPVLLSEDVQSAFTVDASDTNITKFSFAGTTFQDSGIITGQAYNADKDFTSCTFLRCREVKAANGIVTKCVFASAPGPALLLTNTTQYMSYCTFVGCFAALHLTTTTGEYDVTGCSFISNTYDILNATGGTVTINYSACLVDPSTHVTTLTSNNKAQSYNNTGTAYTDESTAAFNDSPYDMNLLAQANEAGDAYLFGNTAAQFTELDLYIPIPGSGTWTLTWEYSTGAGTWSALSGVSDGTSNMRPTTAGTKKVSFTAPGVGWVTATYNSITAYWIRARISSYTSVVYPPKGTEAWLRTTDDVTLSSSITLAFVVTDADGDPLADVLVFIDDSGSTAPFILNDVTDINGEASVNYSGGALVGSIWRARKYGYKQFKQTLDIGSNNITLYVTMVVDPQQT